MATRPQTAQEPKTLTAIKETALKNPRRASSTTITFEARHLFFKVLALLDEILGHPVEGMGQHISF